MNISMSYKMDEAQAAAAVAGLRKLELMRICTGIVVELLGIGVCYAMDEPVGVDICFLVLVVFAALAANWLRIFAHVRNTATASTRLTSISISDEGVSRSHTGGPVSSISWRDVSHCTNTTGTWIFAVKGKREAILLPQTELAAADREQVARLLATWPKRRYRTTPW